MKQLYTGTVTGGKLMFSNRKQFDEQIKAFEGKRVVVEVDRLKSKHSDEQRGYLWAVVYPCALQGFTDAGHIGLSKEDVHKFFKDQFSTEYLQMVNPNTGEVKALGKTTRTMNKTQMVDYITQIQIFCAEWLNVTIPAPDPLFALQDDEA